MSINKVNTLLCGTALLLFAPVLAADEKEENEMPDIEFLEFLGTWQDSDGKWVDPMQFKSEHENDNERHKAEEQTHE